MNEYPQPTPKEFVVEGDGYRINHLEADSTSKFVVVTLPGLGGSASVEYSNLTEGNKEKPHGLAVSYLHEFNPESLITGLVREIEVLARKGQVNVILHACSYGASILPPLIAKLKDMAKVHIKGIMVRSPLLDKTCMQNRLLEKDDDTLIRLFGVGMAKQAKNDKRQISLEEAEAHELLKALPPTMDPGYVATLRDKQIPLTTISFTADGVINNARVVELMDGYGDPVPLASSKEFMGHYPKDVDEMRTHERGWVAGHMPTA